MTNPWIRLQQKNPAAKMNLICFPFAGGFAEYYLPWRSHMPNELQLCPMQLPGRSYRFQESMYTNIQQLLAVMLPVIEAIIFDKPYIIFGHSMGGYIIYELCKTLQQLQLPLPKLLVVSSIPAPKFWMARKFLSELSEKEFSDFFFDLGGFHPELLKHEKFIQMQMLLLRNDILLCESCRYEKSANFPFPILALGGKEDEYVNSASITDWACESTADFQLEIFPGRHFYLNDYYVHVLNLIHQRMATYDYLQ